MPGTSSVCTTSSTSCTIIAGRRVASSGPASTGRSCSAPSAAFGHDSGSVNRLSSNRRCRHSPAAAPRGNTRMSSSGGSGATVSANSHSASGATAASASWSGRSSSSGTAATPASSRAIDAVSELKLAIRQASRSTRVAWRAASVCDASCPAARRSGRAGAGSGATLTGPPASACHAVSSAASSGGSSSHASNDWPAPATSQLSTLRRASRVERDDRYGPATT